MSEFNNRISAQRDILSKVNEVEWSEELFGLSNGAISRWAGANNIQKQSELFLLINEAAEKLFFLSNKSQEQITEEYKHLSLDVSALTSEIEIAVGRFNVKRKRFKRSCCIL
jgi:hypothetical protein